MPFTESGSVVQGASASKVAIYSRHCVKVGRLNAVRRIAQAARDKKEGVYWPLTDEGTYPPAIEKLVDSYEEFYYDWDMQMSEADYDEPHSPDAFGVCTICGSKRR